MRQQTDENAFVMMRIREDPVKGLYMKASYERNPTTQDSKEA
jgi:hypothetical protein